MIHMAHGIRNEYFSGHHDAVCASRFDRSHCADPPRRLLRASCGKSWISAPQPGSAARAQARAPVGHRPRGRNIHGAEMNENSSYSLFDLGDVELQSGETLLDAKLAYKTYGTLSADGDNVVVLPTFMTGTHRRNEQFFGTGRAIDPSRHFIVSVNQFGNGMSTSPTFADPCQRAARFPTVTLHDNVRCQRRLLTETLGVSQIALVAGWSIAGCQAYEWAAQCGSMVKAIVPICASAKTSPHNFVFLEGLKAALCADQNWNNGEYSTPPKNGLKAFARVYAGWAYSQRFYRERLYVELGFDSIESFLASWESSHLEDWDANNLLAKIRSWQEADISMNAVFSGDFVRALQSITARTIIVSCRQDLYFTPDDNAIEVENIRNGELRVYDSPWGHCAADPQNDKAFGKHVECCFAELLDA
jgi:homoserine O-acetyltransferase/O-succinyltransferase